MLPLFCADFYDVFQNFLLCLALNIDIAKKSSDQVTGATTDEVSVTINCDASRPNVAAVTFVVFSV
jgi:hypothetical protein